MANTPSCVDFDEEPESICWTCMRAGWGCLCEWPHCRIPGIHTVSCEVDFDGNPLERVMVCQSYWPEKEVVFCGLQGSGTETRI